MLAPRPRCGLVARAAVTNVDETFGYGVPAAVGRDERRLLAVDLGTHQLGGMHDLDARVCHSVM